MKHWKKDNFKVYTHSKYFGRSLNGVWAASFGMHGQIYKTYIVGSSVAIVIWRSLNPCQIQFLVQVSSVWIFSEINCLIIAACRLTSSDILPGVARLDKSTSRNAYMVDQVG